MPDSSSGSVFRKEGDLGDRVEARVPLGDLGGFGAGDWDRFLFIFGRFESQNSSIFQFF